MSRPHKLTRADRPRFAFGNLRKELEEHCRASGEAWIDALGDLGVPLRQWVDGVVRDLGGPDKVSVQQKSMIILAAKSLLIIESVDRFLFAMPSVINRSRRQLFGIVSQRKELVSAFGKEMSQIGITLHDPETDSLVDALKARYAERSVGPARLTDQTQPTQQFPPASDS